MILNECKLNKKFLNHLTVFQNTFKSLYDSQNIKIKDFHMKYLYNKFEKLCFPDDLDTIFNYCNSFNDVGILRIELNFSYLFNKEKQIFLHKYIIFYTEDIKRLTNSEHLS